ncbi:MAG: ferredoxin [Sciscionella sp.]
MPWALRGLRNGIVTTRYPRKADPDISYDSVVRPLHGPIEVGEVAGLCPTGAITVDDRRGPRVDQGRCIGCGHCVRERPQLFGWTGGELARTSRDALIVPESPQDDEAVEAVRRALAKKTAAFGRSLHVRHVDCGSDGSEEWEILALQNPVYDLHRLGVFFTASPRHADVLLVTGAGARGMAAPLRRTLEATPRPVVVIAAGTDAISGGLIAPTYAVASEGIGELIDVDIWVPGSPPTPLALLHALLLATGRAVSLGRGSA